MSSVFTAIDNINAERSRHGLSKSDLCTILGINRSTYLVWEQRGDLPMQRLLECSKVFGCDPEYLMRDVGKEKRVTAIVKE